jgi:hypothetical protein
MKVYELRLITVTTQLLSSLIVGDGINVFVIYCVLWYNDGN